MCTQRTAVGNAPPHCPRLVCVHTGRACPCRRVGDGGVENHCGKRQRPQPVPDLKSRWKIKGKEEIGKAGMREDRGRNLRTDPAPGPRD